MLLGLADQQTNKGNPRLFDFRGAIQDIKADAGPNSLVLFEPTDMRYVLEYYAPELRSQPLSLAVSARSEGSPVFVLASFQSNKQFFNETNKVVGQLTFFRKLVRRFKTAPNARLGVSMSSRPWDVRLRRVTWEPVPTTWSVRRRVRLLILLGVPFAVWYFGWLLNPDRVGTPYLYGILIAAELFNLTQALGFWWTCANERVREKRAHRPSGWRSTSSSRSTRSRRTSST